MKKIVNLFCAVALVCASAVACEKAIPWEMIEGTPPVKANAELTEFMNKHLPTTGGRSDYFFVDNPKEGCLLINSYEDLRTYVPTPIELPEIDFEQYSLVVGQYCARDGGFILHGYRIDTEPETMSMNILVERTAGVHHAAIMFLYCWGLHSKLPEKPIIVNAVVYEK